MRRLQRPILAGLALPALLALSPGPAGAEDLKCSAPPYGDAAWNYARLRQRFASVDEDKVDDLLERLCQAKFDHIDRRHFRKLGITDRELGRESTTQLAARILSATRGGTQTL
ncbi:MAG: hypothetical protein ACRETZ_00700 [Steroidobacteraceae bacterium]